MKRQRLTRQSWIDAGLDALIAQGSTALAAEPLARQLGATKGSFYWHFKDVPDFQKAVVKDWQSRAFADVVSALAEDGNAEQRLRQFGARILSDEQDPAMRAWALTAPTVARAVAQVDSERLRYTVNLLRHLGIKNPAFAQSCLGALIGLPQVRGDAAPAAAFDTMVDLVLALK
ncbi:TetR/AcrR family transcriptional regulator [Roseobacter sp. YSTF-M11]|uniref:TetR/AcrR family transcriptional regulator n=1 Tax=Roseobacter insulae TaxID=2859783 RepID=A0A9X1JXI8_9RHOB|nr:TetR/AcrR family transcriptional regulator [Roseobacter insulae]MBW4707295.1 TetR/AcrR family transcriptional regulator [Roseobacter insulae]